MNEAALNVPNALPKNRLVRLKSGNSLTFYSFTTFNCMRSPGKWIAFLASLNETLPNFCNFFAQIPQFFTGNKLSKICMFFPKDFLCKYRLHFRQSYRKTSHKKIQEKFKTLVFPEGNVFPQKFCPDP